MKEVEMTEMSTTGKGEEEEGRGKGGGGTEKQKGNGQVYLDVVECIFPGMEAKYSLGDAWKRSSHLWIIPFALGLAWLSIPLADTRDSDCQNVFLFVFNHGLLYISVTVFTATMIFHNYFPSILSRRLQVGAIIICICTDILLLLGYHHLFGDLNIIVVMLSTVLSMSPFLALYVYSIHIQIQRYKQLSSATSSSEVKLERVREGRHPYNHLFYITMALMMVFLTYFFCQIFTFLYFRYADSSGIQILFSFSYPILLIPFRWAIIYFVRYADKGMDPNDPQSLPLTPEVEWIMQLFYLMFYRNLFTRVRSAETAAILQAQIDMLFVGPQQ